MGICARALMPMDLANFDPEVALPSLSQQHLPELLVGVILAGIFASSISTADSQILTCSTVIGKDLGLNQTNKIGIQKGITVLVICLIAFVAIQAMDSVFNLVILSWSLLAAVFVPLVLLNIQNINLTPNLRVLMISLSLGLFLIGTYFGAGLPVHPLLIAWAPSLVFVLLKYLLRR